MSIDLTGVAKQGPGGAAAEGEMVAVGMVYNPVPEDRRQWADPHGRRPAWQARYVASLEGQEAVAEPLRHLAGQVGMGGAERWIAVCDGGAGLEDLLRRPLRPARGGDPRLLPRLASTWGTSPRRGTRATPRRPRRRTRRGRTG